MSRPVAASLLSAILLAGLFLRCHRLGERGFWLDENYSAEISAGHGFGHFDLPTNRLISSPPDLQSLSADEPWWHILTEQGRDVHPPLYFVALHGWRVMVGSSDVALRLFSVVCSLFAVVLLYKVGAALYGRAAGLWVALLMMLAMSQLELARQARSYSMLVAVAALALLATVKIETDGWNLRRGVVLAVSMLVAIGTHWLALGFFAGLVVYIAIALPTPSRRYALSCIAISALLVVLALLPLELFQMRHAAYLTWWLQDREPHHVAHIFMALRDLPSRLFGVTYGALGRLTMVWWIIFLLAPVGVLRGRRDLLLATITFFTTLLFPLTVDLAHGTLVSIQTRYLILAVAPMCLLFAGVFKSGVPGSKVIRHVLPFTVATYALVALLTFYSQPANEDWKKITLLIEHESRPGEPIIFACVKQDDPEATPGTAYLCASRYLSARHAIFLTDKPLTSVELESTGTKTACLFNGWSFAMPEVLAPGSTVEEFRWMLPIGYVCRIRFAR